MSLSSQADRHRSLAHPVVASAGGRPTRRTWSARFGDAWRGIKFGVRGQSSFFVHFFVAALVIAAAIALRASAMQWGLLIFAIGLVLTAELMNSAIETLFHSLDPRIKERGWRALDIAAGAVLLASITAAAIGLLVFVPLLGELIGW